MWISLIIQGVSKRALQCHSRCYCVASVTKTYKLSFIRYLELVDTNNFKIREFGRSLGSKPQWACMASAGSNSLSSTKDIFKTVTCDWSGIGKLHKFRWQERRRKTSQSVANINQSVFNITLQLLCIRLFIYWPRPILLLTGGGNRTWYQV
jgi:hypothetical protein